MGLFNWLKKDKKNKEKTTNSEIVDDSTLQKEEITSEVVAPYDIEAEELSQKNADCESNSTFESVTNNNVEITSQNEGVECLTESSSVIANEECEKVEIQELKSEVDVRNETEVDSVQENSQTKELECKEVSKKDKGGFFKRIKNALKKTKDAISNKIDSIFHKELDDEFFEDLEDILISSDLGFETSEEIIDILRTKCKKEKLKTCEDAKTALREVISDMITENDSNEFDDVFPKVIIIVGVNGVGKTTSIGKLANYYSNLGKKVVVVAGDTFRAAASAQLNVWATRADVKIVKQEEGADSASVVFDGISFAKSKGFDVVLVDTAGRLHNKVNLMEELSKVNRVATKNWEGAHFERYIVLDATTGQNAVNQVREFDSAIDLSGIVLTKLDGTAKGGIVVSICNEFEIPVKFVGVGEGIDDLVPFDANEFVEGII